VTAAWSWTQYPSSPSVTEVTEVPDGFVGKNAIVWTGDGAFEEFVVGAIDNNLVTTDRDLKTNGICHFTLDKETCTTQVLAYENSQSLYNTGQSIYSGDQQIDQFPTTITVGEYRGGMSHIRNSDPRVIKVTKNNGECLHVR
jgi:hypothetical protein